METKKEIKFPKLVSEMEKKKVPQSKLAELIGISQASISRKLNGEFEWTIGEVETICEYFKKDYYQLFR